MKKQPPKKTAKKPPARARRKGGPKRHRALHIPLRVLAARRDRLIEMVDKRAAAGENGKQV